MATRYIVFKPTEIASYESANGRCKQSQYYIRFDGDFSGTRRVVSSITMSSEDLSSYLNTDINPSTPYVPQYPGSPATKKYVDDNIPTKVSDLTNDSDFQTATQVNQAISAAVSSAYKYKGSVANQAALPASGNTTGDVWNTEDTGMNYAWTGSAWDALGTIVDLSGKQDKLIAGSNIQIASDGKTISAIDTKYTAGNGINIDSNNEISANTTVLATKTDLNSKQDTISDLAAIRSGAGLGATAVQPGDNISDLNNDSGFITNSYHDSTKQDTLVSGTNIKTVNNQSLLGSGNISINGILSGAIIPPASATYTGKIWFDTMNNKFWGCDGTTWTEITPVLSVNGGTGSITVNDVKVSTTAPSSPTEGMIWYDTTNDVLNVYDGTQWNTIDTNTTYTAGDNIQISSSNVISATDTTYNAGEGIEFLNISDYSAIQGPAPEGFHIPSESEWGDIKNIWKALGGGNYDGINFSIALKLPLNGRRRYDTANVEELGSQGNYWSYTPNGTNSAYFIYFNSSVINYRTYSVRSNGFAIRCFKDSPVIPDNTWTKLYGTSIETGGIFWNSTDGLISLSSDGQTWKTIADKNLGATSVWNSGDTETDANCGYFYQWGNNYGFSHSGAVTTSSTQVDASNYGPGNYYNNSTFIIRTANQGDWSSVSNDNLWGATTGVITTNNIITNTGVLSVNGQTGDVIIDDNTKIFVVNEPALTSGGSISDIEPFKDICERLISNPKHIVYITNKRSIMPHELEYIGSVMQIISHSGQFLDENNWMFNFIYIGFPFAENKEFFKYYGDIQVADGTARVANITANKINFTPSNSGTAGQVLTKTSSNYEWKDASGGLQVAPNSPITGIKYLWYGTEEQYAALTQYYTDTPGDTEFRCF